MGQGTTADIALSFFLAAGFGLTAIYVAIARRHRATWKIGVVLLLACAEITLAHILRGVSADLPARVFWYKMSLVGFAISTSSFFSLALQYTKAKSELRPRTLLLLSVFPLLTTALILTNEFHGLIWDPTSTSQIVEKTFFPSANEAGIWYWIFVAYSFFIMGLGCFILIRWIIQSRGFYSRQALGVVVAAILAFLGSALDIFRVSPMEPFIATALGLASGTITVAFALIPFRRHDILNVSRGAIIDNIDDCVIVVDEDNRVALANPATQKLMGKTESQVLGRNLEQFLPSLVSNSTFRLNQNGEVALNIEAVPHTFDMQISVIHDWQGRLVSRIIVLRNITGRKQAEQALLRSEITLAEAQRISHLGSWEWDYQSDKIQFSDEMFRIIGLLPGELKVTRDVFLKFLHPEEVEGVLHEIQYNATYPAAGIEHRVILPNGEIRKVHSWIKAYRDQNGKPLRLLGSTQDITERKQYEAQILLQSTALESAVNGIMITDADGKVLWVNSSLKQMTGYAPIELIGVHPPFFGKAPKDINCYEDLLEIIRTKRSWQGEVFNVRKDGTGFIAEMSFTPVTREGGEITHYISICQDISEKIEAKEKLEYLATHDVLTGLPNRLLFNDRLNHALAMANRTGRQGAILLIDLDDFKAINDTFSHDDGDEFLKLIAERINNCIRESDTVARIGGDEFTVLLENIEQNDVIIVAKKLNWALSEKATIRGNAIVSTASIGISTFPQDGDAVQQLIKNADLAMYQAKENKNSFQFYGHEMSARIEKQMELTSYLRYALQNDIFQLYYQPQVNSTTGKATRMEALLRLPHPEKKWISPAEFIPVAEKTGLITSIDEWVLRTACKKLGELINIGYPDIVMAVNLSTRQLNQPNLFSLLQAVIKENNINPGCLELEISEGSIFQNMDTAFRTMSKLKAMGIKLAIDDFGTGHASLNYLSYFPLDTLKIDLSFTKKILFSISDAAIVTGVIAIANNLGLDVIVEGVEKKEQLKFFSDLECYMIQGYIFSPAVPGNEIINLLNKGFAQS